VNELELLETAKNKRVLFCGERIIDVYHYVKPLGRPTKDAIVSVEREHAEAFEGGVAAACAHVRDMCNVEMWQGGSTTRKERFVESSHVRKLFEFYAPGGLNIAPMPRMEDYDAVVVLDYGHGMATPEFIKSLEAARYLAVNVQTNSGNYGYNLATKYPRADYLCVDESEARLATQNRTGPIEDSLFKLAEKAKKTVITLGKAGAVGYCGTDRRTVRTSAYTNQVVDTMGAGDAFFAVTAIVAERASIASLLRLGNAAAALKTKIIGHQRSINKRELIQFLAGIPDKVRGSAVDSADHGGARLAVCSSFSAVR
jgi:bifunctional ADP-heptose synthase (sugar kinase/adenylyltransferase)